MSSGTPTDPYAATQYLQSDKFVNDFGAPGGPHSLTPRQMRMNALWAAYRCQTYDGRKVAWDGTNYGTHLEQEQIATEGYIPNGFDSPATVPVRFRRPTAPYYLTKIVVDRFTGLLFGERRQPAVVVEGDTKMTDWLVGLIEESRLWAKMIQARKFGGAQGTVVMSFSVVNGKPVFEPHDARWCTPVFSDRSELTLSAVDKRYVYKDGTKDPDTGEYIEGWFWYRRLITDKFDCEWPKVPVIDNDEPEWTKWRYNLTEHNLGVCPAVWIQNTPMDEDIDGDPDCQGAYDLMAAHDQLMSQAHKSLLYACDPTTWAATDDKLPAQLTMGSPDHVLQLSKGSSLGLLETTGSGPTNAMALADKIRERAFELCACVPENTQSDKGPSTAFEVMTRTARMFEQCDVFREQYGERGIKRLLQIAVLTERKLNTPRLISEHDPITDVVTTKSVRYGIKLPPKAVTNDAGETELVQRALPPTTLGAISLKWPRYFDPSLEDINKAVTATVTAKQGTVIDDTVAVDFLKQYLPINDARALVERLKTANTVTTAVDDTGGW